MDDGKKAKYLKELVENHNKGVDLSASYLQKQNGYLHKLYSRAITIYKDRENFSWVEVLKDAGLPADDIIKHKYHSKKDLIKDLKERITLGKPMNTGAIKEDDKALYCAMIRHFGNFSNGLRAVKLDPAKVAKNDIHHYTIEEIIVKIKDAHLKGLSLNYTTITSDENSPLRKYLYRADKLLDKGWAEAVAKAGIDYSTITRRSNIKFTDHDDILKFLVNKYPEGVITGIGHSQTVYRAIKTNFGTIDEAAKQARLIYAKSGRLSKKMLEQTENQEILLERNKTFLDEIADKFFYATKKFMKKSLDKQDYFNAAFIYFIEILPDKPAKSSIKDYARNRISKVLSRINRQLFREVTFGNESYLDNFNTEAFFNRQDHDK